MLLSMRLFRVQLPYYNVGEQKQSKHIARQILCFNLLNLRDQQSGRGTGPQL